VTAFDACLYGICNIHENYIVRADVIKLTYLQPIKQKRLGDIPTNTVIPGHSAPDQIVIRFYFDGLLLLFIGTVLVVLFPTTLVVLFPATLVVLFNGIALLVLFVTDFTVSLLLFSAASVVLFPSTLVVLFNGMTLLVLLGAICFSARASPKETATSTEKSTNPYLIELFIIYPFLINLLPC
jgi:hypothetical protein